MSLINYVPHNKYIHIATKREDNWDTYLANLSSTVNRACDRFFDKRGIERNHQFVNSAAFNKTQAK
jgi:hypothetical protein